MTDEIEREKLFELPVDAERRIIEDYIFGCSVDFIVKDLIDRVDHRFGLEIDAKLVNSVIDDFLELV